MRRPITATTSTRSRISSITASGIRPYLRVPEPVEGRYSEPVVEARAPRAPAPASRPGSLSREPRLHELRDDLPVRPALDLGQERLHHRAHVLHPLRADRLHRRVHLRAHLVRRELLRQVPVEDHDLRVLLVREVLPVPGLVLLDRVAPALHLRRDDALDPRVVERLHELDLAVLDGALQHADRVQLELGLLPHRGLHVLVELLLETHGVGRPGLEGLAHLLHRALLRGDRLLLLLHRRLLVVLALADLREDPRLLALLLEALHRVLEGLAVLHTHSGHSIL